MEKKGAELSMNVIIIAAIALIVLVILAVLVLRAGANVNQGTTKSCVANGGLCKTPEECTNEQVRGTFNDCDANKICCKVV
ncbi:MAG: hypothetical protein QXG00_00290 [Candidatus Woesearchaeota archaeon]